MNIDLKPPLPNLDKSPRSPPRPNVLNLITTTPKDDDNHYNIIHQDQTPIKHQIHTDTDEDNDENRTIHDFNKCTNITVIEQPPKDSTNTNQKHPPPTDGSDSGVEFCNNTIVDNDCRELVLQRALSSTSGGGYSSSSCGNAEDGTLAFSCDSSIVSCCSNYEDAFDILTTKNSTLLEDLSRHAAARNDERTSENGSESSSITGSICGGRTPKSSLSSRRVNALSTVKKKVAVTEPARQSRNRCSSSECNTPSRSRSKSNTSRNTATNLIKTPPTTPKSRKTSTNIETKLSNNVTKNQLNTARAKVDTNITRRDTSLSRTMKTRTPVSTPSDDGRWPSTGTKSTAISMARSVRGSSVASDTPSISMTSSAKSSRLNQILNVDNNKSSALEKYATLPRRRRERTPDCSSNTSTIQNHTRSRSRETSLTRTPMPVRSNKIPRERESISGKFLPPYPKKKVSKTKIYHEISSQTALTSTDLENVFNGANINKSINPEAVEKVDCGIQVERHQELIERLENQLKEMTERNRKLLQENDKQSEKMEDLEQQLKIEKEEKQAAKDELERNAQRVLAMVQNNDEISKDGCDSLLALETQFKKAGQIVINQEREISDLQALCRSLQRDLHKSIQTQETLIKQQQDMETESNELKEFMQAEKTTLAEVLRDTEEDVRIHINKLKQKELELQRQQEECKHLVRISEQRRQENLAMQARLGCLEARSRELLLQQGAAVSGAAVALSGLTARLESLVTQLVQSYNISEQDLEDAIYHNEAYSNSESSEGSPTKSADNRRIVDGVKRTPSPKRGASFVSAVINAIRNAAAQTAIRAHSIPTGGGGGGFATDSEDTDSGELLDSETEPVLMMESVLEDVILPDTHSHNMVSSTHSLITSSSRLGQSSESLHNLSQSIIARQQLERTTALDKLPPSPAFTLVDQVIDVDNMVTKLLKVLRIIQIDNDAYVDDLHDERTQLKEQIETQQEACKAAVRQLQDWEKMGAHLKAQRTEITKQLEARTQELNETKTDLQVQRKEVERLNEDICKLSMLCSQTELKLRTREDEANATLKQWQETGKLPTVDVLARLVTARHEIPALKEKLTGKEKELAEITEKYSTSKQVMTESWNQAISETRRQYEAIDAALETLLSIQNVVEKCPPLAKLQHDLEEISFQCASSVPLVPSLVASDFNANANHRLEAPSPATAKPINGTA